MKKLLALLTFSGIALSQSIFFDSLKSTFSPSEEGIDLLVLPVAEEYYQGKCHPFPDRLCRMASDYVKHCLTPLLNNQNLEKVAEWAAKNKDYTCTLSLLYRLGKYEEIAQRYAKANPVDEDEIPIFLYGNACLSAGYMTPSLYGYLYNKILIARSLEKAGKTDLAKKYYSYLLYAMKYPMRERVKISIFPYDFPKEADWLPFIEKKVKEMGYEYYIEYLKDGLKWIEECKVDLEKTWGARFARLPKDSKWRAYEQHMLQRGIMKYESEIRAELEQLTQRR